MSKCIRKAAHKCFLHYSFVFCYFHLKQNLFKKVQFTPSESLWICLQMFMKGEITFEDFQKKWIEEETRVNVEAIRPLKY